MIPTQRLPPSLTPLEEALAALLDGLEPVARVGLSLADALGCVAADMPPLMAMAGHCVPAISSARRPIRRCRWPDCRSGSKPAMPCRRVAIA